MNDQHSTLEGTEELAPASWGWAFVYGVLMLGAGSLGYFLHRRYVHGPDEWVIGLGLGMFIGLSLAAPQLWLGLRREHPTQWNSGM
jgi:hypothetical protein